MTEFKPYPYQIAAIQWITTHPRCALFLDMGLGKTVCTLTAARTLQQRGDIGKVLVVAPKMVAQSTWSDEARKWSHLADMCVSCAVGTEPQRRKALATDADIYVIGRDNLVWLMSQYEGAHPYDMIAIDELTSFKSYSSKRFRAMKVASRQCKRVVGLTGTPAPNGYLDLWAQIYCIDLGERLGKYITHYRNRYFNVKYQGYIPIWIAPKQGSEQAIRAKISDICLSMQATDYLTLPSLIIHDVRVTMPDAAARRYAKFERDRVMEFTGRQQGGAKVTIADSAAVLIIKLSQYANGAIYDDERNVEHIHDAKTDALTEIVEAAQSPVLVFYQYQHDIGRIAAALKGHKVRIYKSVKELEDWNAGRIGVLLAHPASTAFGLNMQQGGHYIVWFGTGWNLELYQQANARLHRQGQQYPVHVYRIITAGTVDERMVLALDSKKDVQQSLMDGLKYLIDKHTK